MKLTLLEITQNPLEKIGGRAGLCWGSDITDKEKNIERGMKCIKDNHGRVLEFVNLEILLEDISIRVGREWYTHIAGSPTRLQESTRYIDMNNFNYFIPPSIRTNERALMEYNSLMDTISSSYAKLKDLDVPNEDISNILPLGSMTKIVTKANLRMILEMSNNRLCKRAYHEYRDIMIELKKQLSGINDEWKWICDNYMVPKCAKLGYCPENKSNCLFPPKGNLK